jgi:hypothetical protein
MNKTLLSTFALCLTATAVMAQNPIIRDQFTADPTARVFNNKVYLYPSHDIKPPQGQRQDWFCMEDYHVFSSENLTDWTDHGVIVTQNKVPWVRPDSYSMWAPDCVERNGKYYFYFPSTPAGAMRGFGVGVAISDSPEGPFVCEPEPIKGINGIDPCVLQASDGNAYIFWGAGRCAKLKPNMKELADDTPKEKVKWGDREFEMMGVNCLKDLPNRQAEGPFAFEANGWYYLTYPYVREKTEVLGYAMSKNPMGPYEYKGIIMTEHPNCWTNHHSIVNYKGQWYLFYHQNAFSPNDDKRRSVQIEKLFFNADGTIQEVRPTLRGVGINQATEKIEIDRYSTASADVTTQLIDTVNTFRSYQATLPTKGSWLKYDDIDFSCLTDGYLIINAKAADNTRLFVREKAANGKVIAKFDLTVKPETPAGMPAMFRRDFSNQWLTLTAPLEYTPKGVSDLVITVEGDAGISIDWVQFKNRPKYFTHVESGAMPSHPDNDGFIRRWLILEPIDKPNSGNTVFTDSYLREHFNREYFKGQQTIIPKDGQKVKAVFQQEQAPAGFGRGMQAPAQPEIKTVKQTLTWHALDSENYNVKLFRFAEKWGEKVYGVLFWTVTIIDCDEDIADVRLAVGSNSASMWWLNGEEALLLSGDRRMVKDDAMSPRLTLKKGRNILRGAIINGPGMSDFCVRFLDEKGQPVTGYALNIK